MIIMRSSAATAGAAAAAATSSLSVDQCCSCGSSPDLPVIIPVHVVASGETLRRSIQRDCSSSSSSSSRSSNTSSHHEEVLSERKSTCRMQRQYAAGCIASTTTATTTTALRSMRWFPFLLALFLARRRPWLCCCECSAFAISAPPCFIQRRITTRGGRKTDDDSIGGLLLQQQRHGTISTTGTMMRLSAAAAGARPDAAAAAGDEDPLALFSADELLAYQNNNNNKNSNNNNINMNVTPNSNATTYASHLSTSATTTSTTNAPPAETSLTVRSNKTPTRVTTTTSKKKKKEMELMWCDANVCKDDLRERTVGGQIVMRGPATGQVAYHWSDDDFDDFGDNADNNRNSATATATTTVGTAPQQQQCVLFLVKQGSDMDALLTICADAVKQLTTTHGSHLRILLDPGTAARLKHYHGVDGEQIHLFEAAPTAGFGEHVMPDDLAATELYGSSNNNNNNGATHQQQQHQQQATPLAAGSRYNSPDLIVTIGGDGLLMHAGMLFQGPMPPILCVSGGSLGFLTPFSPTEMVDAIEISLGLLLPAPPAESPSAARRDDVLQVFPPNMLSSYPYEDDDDELVKNEPTKQHKFAFGLGDCICLSIRMRLDCRIINREGAIKARYNVLNEVVVDRGSSPYLAALECFCDDVHLTTVQADGVIFATPTGSTAYSLAAGSSVVHPAVPCILVTPICPHVLSFRSMVFPDHVVLRCYVPDDARAEASVAFDGKHRQELRRGDSVQIQMSAYPVPTINRKDHSADWLNSLKRNFNFNARPRQRPL